MSKINKMTLSIFQKYAEMKIIVIKYIIFFFLIACIIYNVNKETKSDFQSNAVGFVETSH